MSLYTFGVQQILTSKNFRSVEKVAILLSSFGEELAAQILKELPEHEVKSIAQAMSKVGRINRQDVDQLFEEFHKLLGSQDNFSRLQGGAQFTKRVLQRAFAGGKNPELVDEIEKQLGLDFQNRLEILQRFEPEMLARTIANEHQQIIAVILLHLDPIMCGETLKRLPEEKIPDLILRMCRIQEVNPMMLDEVAEFLHKEWENQKLSKNFKVGGKEKVAEVLNYLNPEKRDQLLQSLEEKDAELTEQIQELLFKFDDLVHLSDKSIQKLIVQIPRQELVIAFKKISEPLAKKIIVNMSKSSAQLLIDDVKNSAKIKLSDVEKAQNNILQKVKKMIEGGELEYVHPNEKYV